eukprot:TRINITY_DN5732_c6_g1_i1.p1 TRINITY_DN5732_c6_g1~~TRINITY_DN5732_c6_g1_i1.p1  ORF type:complete len:179 (+),score=30.91 TRINITY_DN5732_c6_g1_i1:62-538(+)
MTEIKSDIEVRKDIEKRTGDAKKLLERHYYAAWDGGIGESRLESRPNATGVVEKHAKVYFLYRPDASISWNGNVINKEGVDALIQHTINIKTKHVITSLDVQPVLENNHSLVTATGVCTYSDETKRKFSHMLIIWKETHATDPDRSMHWIIHDNFRWI